MAAASSVCGSMERVPLSGGGSCIHGGGLVCVGGGDCSIVGVIPSFYGCCWLVSEWCMIWVCPGR